MPRRLTPTVQLVLQASPFCNIDCTYCYLPDRSDRSVMSMEVITKAFAFLAANDLAAEEIDLRWHAGEPLVVGPEFYDRAAAAASTILGPRARVRHSVQTNGTLVDARWCDLFRRLDFQVGVSIDGPAALHDSRRISRRGQGTFDRTLRGIRILQQEGICFDTISVVTSDTLRHQDDFLGLLEALRPRSVGLNVEETEGPSLSVSFARADFVHGFRAFLRRVNEWQRQTGIPVRELRRIQNLILGAGSEPVNTQNAPFAILSVDVRGNLYTFSPELAGLRHSRYASFAIGNVLTDSLEDVLANPTFRALAEEIDEGVEACRRTCPYFLLCGGGAPSNKLFENGTFASTETAMCRCITKAASDIVLEDFESHCL